MKPRAEGNSFRIAALLVSVEPISGKDNPISIRVDMLTRCPGNAAEGHRYVSLPLAFLLAPQGVARERQYANVDPGQFSRVPDAAVYDDPRQTPGRGYRGQLVSQEGATPRTATVNDEDTTRCEIFQRLPDKHVVLVHLYGRDRTVETVSRAVGGEHGFANLDAFGETVADVRRLDVSLLRTQRAEPITACQNESRSPGTNGR